MRDRTGRGVRKVAIEPVLVQRKAGDRADRIADLKPMDARSDGGDGPRSLVSQASRQLGLFQVLAPAEHRFSAVQPQRLDADLDFALAWRRDFDLFHAQDFGAAELVETNARHHVALLPM